MSLDDTHPHLLATMHIEIQKDRTRGFQVRVVDANGRLIRMFIYHTIESARRAAKAWTVAYGNCPIRDRSGEREPGVKE